MPLTVDRYTVLLQTDPAADPTEHEVTVIHGDRMRAELEAPKHPGFPPLEVGAMHWIALWLWAACVRSKVLPPDVGFQRFHEEVLLAFDEVPDAPQFPGSPPVADPMGPTEEGTGSPSSSPESSETSAAGSTPTPTPA